MPGPPDPPPAYDQSCGRIEILVRPVGPPHERRGHALLSRAHQDRLGAHRHRAAPIGAAGRTGLVFDQGDTLAIDRDVDVFPSRVRARHQIDLEDVLRVVGKDIIDDHPAARAIRRAVDVVPRMLRDVAGSRVRVIDRRRVTIANRHARDRARRVQIRIEQRRRQHLCVGDIVEVGALRIEREPVAGIHVERQQLADGSRVLWPVEALKGADAGIRVRGSGGVDRRFKRRHERRLRRRIRTRGQRRRHQARLQLADHLLGDLSVLRGARHVERRERQPARFPRIVVARNAVAANHRVVIGRGRCGRRFLTGGRRSNGM